MPKSTSSSQIAGSSQTSMIAGGSHALRTDPRALEPAKYESWKSQRATSKVPKYLFDTRARVRRVPGCRAQARIDDVFVADEH